MPAPKGNQFWKNVDPDKIGRPRTYENKEEMIQRISEYFNSYIPDDTGIANPVLGFKPTVTGLALFLGFENRQSLYDYRDNYKDFSGIIKKALTYIEMNYEMLLESKASTGAIFALKNMGWRDKTELSHEGGDPKKPLQIIGMNVIDSKS
ncbi:terminase small subunit [Aquimarina algiphila]|uniref:Uncharacterized protein n=1 Tax=Aquimarina algiphila TaxID=2047982 RepID=A0A554VE10_9FLAO|nr:terminase small subunit [Aquimarina algiphila]TSE05241.1 hypothetical protein FOF46_23545 [Aquimarina algiphila]